MERRAFLKNAALGGAGLLLARSGFGEQVAFASSSLAPASAATSATCRFGAFVNPFGADPTLAVRAFETMIGRPLAITRHYLTWDLSLTGSTISKSVAAGHIPYVAWHATKKGNVAVPWSSIAGGSEDAWIVSQAD